MSHNSNKDMKNISLIIYENHPITRRAWVSFRSTAKVEFKKIFSGSTLIGRNIWRGGSDWEGGRDRVRIYVPAEEDSLFIQVGVEAFKIPGLDADYFPDVFTNFGPELGFIVKR